MEIGIFEIVVALLTPGGGFLGWKVWARAAAAAKLRRRKIVIKRVFTYLHGHPFSTSAVVSHNCRDMTAQETDEALVRLANMNAVVTEIGKKAGDPTVTLTMYSLDDEAGNLYDDL